MNITNKGQKIVHIGALTLLPGESKPLPKPYEGNDTIGLMLEKGVLSCDAPFQSGRTATVPPAQEGNGTTDPGQETGSQGGTTDPGQETGSQGGTTGSGQDDQVDQIQERIKAINKMNRGELDAACEEAGIEVVEGDTIPTLKEKLIAKLQEQ